MVGCRLYYSGLGTKMVLAKHLTWRRDWVGGGSCMAVQEDFGGVGGLGSIEDLGIQLARK